MKVSLIYNISKDYIVYKDNIDKITNMIFDELNNKIFNYFEKQIEDSFRTEALLMIIEKWKLDILSIINSSITVISKQ